LKTNFWAIVQVLTAVALAYLTYELLKATSRYADQVETQTDIMTRNAELSEKTLEFEAIKGQREELIKEMDRLIGPLYSRISDTDIFNPRGTAGGRYWVVSGKIDEKLYEEGAFWQEIAQYKYLAPNNLLLIIDKYLEIKLNSAVIMEWADPNYAKPEKDLKDAVVIRYSAIETDLSTLENRLSQLGERGQG
jgi:hypothetical protein